jgi:hypothetical protein
MSGMKCGWFTDLSLLETDNADSHTFSGGLFSGCRYQERGWPFLFKDLIIGTSSCSSADSATKRNNTDTFSGDWDAWRFWYRSSASAPVRCHISVQSIACSCTRAWETQVRFSLLCCSIKKFPSGPQLSKKCVLGGLRFSSMISRIGSEIGSTRSSACIQAK